MIDLTTYSQFKHTWVVSELTGNLEVTFFVEAPIPMDPDVEVGKIILEPTKARAFFEALFKTSRAVFPDLDAYQFLDNRTKYDNRTSQSVTEFVDEDN